MASNAQMLRMTRDSYFKIAEQQGLTTMREAQVQFNEQSENDPLAKTIGKKTSQLKGWLKNDDKTLVSSPPSTPS